jgi:hypothetical protein
MPQLGAAGPDRPRQQSLPCWRSFNPLFSLLSSPSGFRPMPTVGLATRPKRRPPGGAVSRAVVPSSPVGRSDGRGYGSVWRCGCGGSAARRGAEAADGSNPGARRQGQAGGQGTGIR